MRSYPFEGQDLGKPVPIDPALTYAVPPGTTGQALYFRGGNSTDEMITVLLMGDGQPMRYFPIGVRGGTHVPLRVVEDMIGERSWWETSRWRCSGCGRVGCGRWRRCARTAAARSPTVSSTASR